MLNNLLNHRTIRKYRSTPISEEILNKILEAGTRASTTGNMQVYSIIVTKTETIKKQLWELHFKQDMVLQAPVILTFCADFNRFSKWCLQRNATPGFDNFLSFYTASIDALLIAQNVAVAAESLNLGVCYLGTTTYNAPKIIDLLELPHLVVPVTTLVIGYPEQIPELTDRLPLSGVVHHEKYCDYAPESINSIYHDKENLESSKKLLEINQKQTLAQIFTDSRYKKSDNCTFSQSFLKSIEKQGFMNNNE